MNVAGDVSFGNDGEILVYDGVEKWNPIQGEMPISSNFVLEQRIDELEKLVAQLIKQLAPELNV